MRRVLACHIDATQCYRYLLDVSLIETSSIETSSTETSSTETSSTKTSSTKTSSIETSTRPPRPLAVIQKNPSLADAVRRDPTVGKVEAWARRQRFTRVLYLNLFAWRAPHPTQLNALSYTQAVGPKNDEVICAVLEEIAATGVVAVGWGNPNRIDAARYAQRIDAVQSLLRGRVLHRVGPLTQQSHPRHGLHWNGDLSLERYKSS